MSPTLFLNTQNSWEVNQEEVFAPMASVIRVSDLDEAIAVANDTRFGLTGGIITQSLRNSAIFKQQVQTAASWLTCQLRVQIITSHLVAVKNLALVLVSKVSTPKSSTPW